MNRLFCAAALCSVWIASISGAFAAEQPKPHPSPRCLWEIGKADDNAAEFALAPKDYSKYADDPVFIVGASDAKRDWPYVQPGPGDGWAGGRSHTFTIVFALAEKPQQGECRLVVDLVDTQSKIPPQLVVEVNGTQAAELAMPAGGSDESVYGDPTKGREHRFTIKVPATSLRTGSNEIAITTKSGSWVLYDWIGFEAPEAAKLAPPEKMTLVYGAAGLPTLVEKNGRLYQSIRVTMRHVGEPVETIVSAPGAEPVKLALTPGAKTVELVVPAVEAETKTTVEVKQGDKLLASREVVLKPVRKWTVCLLPHSHVDIGYTKVQTEVEKDHWQYLESAIDAARRTAGNPAGSQFKWNVEVLWAVESYLKQATPEKQQEFIDAVKKGWVGLDALYGNELTALCRPEELVRLVDYSQRLSRQCGVKIDSMMISDVPGYTWGLVSVLSAAGVKYMSVGPNGGDRIGFTLEAWADKPFWWIGPDGKSKVLCWIPEKGYWRAFSGGKELLDQLQRYEAKEYPYDMIQVRYCLGDNHGPAFDLCDIVKEWNARYAYPKLVIATTSEMMHEFDKRYGDKLPEARGDFTPYWEDGAASSAQETGYNRLAAEWLSQAEALWAMFKPAQYPADEFWEAWRNVVLYDEHTWGAHNSISQPDSEFVLAQWKIKQAFAIDGMGRAGDLMANADPHTEGGSPGSTLFVFNATPWTRTEWVRTTESMTQGRYVVKGPDGKPVPSQRLTDNGVAFLASGVPGFGARRYTLEKGQAKATGSAKAQGFTLSNDKLRLTIDPKTGAIASLQANGIDAELVDVKAEMGLNEYLYVAGKNPADAKRAGEVKVVVKENGPAFASLEITGPAPGCRTLTRSLEVVDGSDRVFIMNTLDKEKVRSKEGVHFAFPLAVPDGVMRMETPWAIVRPEHDQLLGACKNWFTVQRWVDVSNDKYGVTCAIGEAPLVEVGSITAELPWIRSLAPSQTFFSYVMNNYWHTNYKADQEGLTGFRYTLRPHAGPYCPTAATRFGIECSQSLMVTSVADDAPAEIPSRLRVTPECVIPVTLKPSNDGKSLIVRLYNVGPSAARPTLAWSDLAPKQIALSNLAEEPQGPVPPTFEIPSMGFVTLRAELP